MNLILKYKMWLTLKRGGKPWPTATLADQLTNTAKLTAADLGPCENNSPTIIQGMEPGPSAKNTM